MWNALCLMLLAVSYPSQDYKLASVDLPELHRIQPAAMWPTYGCRFERKEMPQGYRDSGLFLTNNDRSHDSPSVLFNGGCTGDDYFTVGFGGDDMSLIEDLGPDVPLESVTASLPFRLRTLYPDEKANARFDVSAPVRVGHTYAVLVNVPSRRCLFAFTVVSHEPHERVEVRYKVFHFQLFRFEREAPGFDWLRKSSRVRPVADFG